MKKCVSILIIITLVFLLSVQAFAEEDDWKTMPTITHVYEWSKEKILVEWEGYAPLYQVYVDGKKEQTVNLCNAILDVKAGRHQIQVVPAMLESKNVDSTLGFEFSLPITNAINPSIAANIDLSAFGVDPKDILLGNQSNIISFTYSIDPLYSSVPKIVSAATDFDDNVVLSIKDKQNADAYLITVKSGKDVNYVEFFSSDEELVSRQNSLVTLTLDREYLKRHGCMTPELDEKYSFSVVLEKYAINYVDGTSEEVAIHESKSSKAFDYTPYSAWKNPPEISYASQTADGQITLQWIHDDNGLGCEYMIVQYDKVLGVKRVTSEIGKTSDKEYEINDLLNGKYTYYVVPLFSNEQGLASENVSVEVQNNWVVAPSLECVLEKNNQVILRWTSPQGIESYHIVVSVGSGSLLRFVNLDYKQYTEFDVQASPGDMEYTFTYEGSIEQESGIKLKFELYGIRYTADGTEQKTATTTQTIVVK